MSLGDRVTLALLGVLLIGGAAVICLVVTTWQPPEIREYRARTARFDAGRR